ncbi:hypothetical protein ACE14D_15685, partial [Streptomyces sp. Act-28]
HGGLGQVRRVLVVHAVGTARGGTDPPGGADRRPFVVVGVGAGAILALLGAILVLVLRSCA